MVNAMVRGGWWFKPAVPRGLFVDEIRAKLLIFLWPVPSSLWGLPDCD